MTAHVQTCPVCGLTRQPRRPHHRIGCAGSIARANLVAAAREWHRLMHKGYFDTCQAAECYACNDAVLHPFGEVHAR